MRTIQNGWLATFLFVFVHCVLAHCEVGTAQHIPSHKVKIAVESGELVNSGTEPQIVWEKTIKIKGAVWVQLNFRQIVLAHDPIGNTSSQLRIVSLKDNAEQFLDAKSARQWQNSSAYFNGDSVRLQLIAYPNGRRNQISIVSAVAGDIPVFNQERSICDTVDDRALSTDIRVGRTVPGGCTAWLFNDRQHCALTAGHCASSTQAVEFNVPVSNADGSYNHPGPEDQYPVDPASMQFVNGGPGDDWCYFGLFDNSNTGMTAFETQGDSFQFELPQPVSGGDVIRITGHGTTSSPVNPTLNGAQKTHIGPHSSFTGSRLQYRTDTTGGNSGSPVIYENDGTAIGIHTHGGCSTGGAGSNTGTGANNTGFQAALSNPLGICRSVVLLEFPNGRPSLVDPNGGTTFRVVASDDGAVPASGTGFLHFDDGTGFQSVPMIEVSPNVYDAVFPATPCGMVIEYYVSADDDLGNQYNNPTNAPVAVFSVLSAIEVESAFLDDFESDMSWTVSGDAATGHWERGVPVGGGDRGDPAGDGDGSGSCYLTENVDGNSDVDDGTTVLTSPLMDATTSFNRTPVLSYYRWFSSSQQVDIFVVEISNNGGANWTEVETVGPTGSEVSGGWIKKVFNIADFVPPTNQMQVRFTVSDLGTQAVVEAGVDGVEIQVVDCVPRFVPEGIKLFDGITTGGQLSDLAESDDQYLALDPSPTNNPFKQRIDMVVLAEVDSNSPSVFGIRMEAKLLGGPSGDVIQTVRLLNTQTKAYETIDERLVSGTDFKVELEVAGDLSRFVHPITNEVTARIGFSSLEWIGTPFFWSVEVDQLVWLVE